MRPNPGAILRLALGTAAAISTALLIPDIFALIPSVPDVFTLICRSIGLWGYAYILWASGFLSILHLVRNFGGKIVLDSNGIKLGRFDKVIPWESVLAVTIAERKVFSRVFFIPAYQLSLHYLKPDGKRAAKQIASFQYSIDEFFSLFFFMSKLGCGARPTSLDAFVFKDAAIPELQKIAEEGSLKRVVLTVVIAFGLVTFLARKAVVNYSFNMGNKEFRFARYDKAIGYYSTACALEFSFAPAWDRLARCEFREGDLDSAEAHWIEALKWKPDYVESKLGLSMIYMLKGKLAEADKIIATANRLAPLDEAGYINRAQVDALMGKNHEAISRLEDFVRQRTGREQAVCILARCYIKEGWLDKAEKLLSANPELFGNPYTKQYGDMVLAELKFAEGDNAAAEKLLAPLKRIPHKQPELLVDLARSATASGDFVSAKRYLDAASIVNPDGPWIALARAELAAKDKTQKISSDRAMKKALAFPYKDACLLAACATFFQQNGNGLRAKELAEQALEIDSGNQIAKKLLAELAADKKSGGGNP